MKLGNKEDLLEILDKVASTSILVVGDMMLDRYIWGKVQRISPEAPVPVVEVVRLEDRLGGAGNVARNLTRIGAKTIVSGVVGDDQDGAIVLGLFDEMGADRSRVFTDSSRPTVLKTRVIAHNQQIVRVDRENSESIAGPVAENVSRAVNRAIDDSRAVILSDYGKGTVCDEVLSVIHNAYDSGRLSLRKRPLFVDPHPRNYGRYHAMSAAKPNRREAESASGLKIESLEDAFRAAEVLLEKWNSEIMVISLGEDGMIVREAGKADGFHLETMAREVFDVSGAGDTVTAIYTAALAVGASPVLAGVLANIAAGIVVSEVGTVAVDLDRLRKEVLQWGA